MFTLAKNGRSCALNAGKKAAIAFGCLLGLGFLITWLAEPTANLFTQTLDTLGESRMVGALELLFSGMLQLGLWLEAVLRIPVIITDENGQVFHLFAIYACLPQLAALIALPLALLSLLFTRSGSYSSRPGLLPRLKRLYLWPARAFLFAGFLAIVVGYGSFLIFSSFLPLLMGMADKVAQLSIILSMAVFISSMINPSAWGRAKNRSYLATTGIAGLFAALGSHYSGGNLLVVFLATAGSVTLWLMFVSYLFGCEQSQES